MKNSKWDKQNGIQIFEEKIVKQREIFQAADTSKNMRNTLSNTVTA